MKIGNCEMPDTGNKISVKIATSENSFFEVMLPAEAVARSAFENDIDLKSFKATLDNFSKQTKSSALQIAAWRDEATDKYFNLLKVAGKLKYEAIDFLGGSDYEGENEDDHSISNIKN